MSMDFGIFLTHRLLFWVFLLVIAVVPAVPVMAQTPCDFPVFSNGTRHQTGGYPFGVEAGDVNNDGRLDVVTPDFDGGSISVFLTKPSGGFQDAIISDADSRPIVVKLSDLNNDNNLDAVVLNQPRQKFSVLLGDGTGSFSIHVQYPANEPRNLRIADVNNDNKQDLLIIAGSSIGGVFFYPGVGDGSFSKPTETSIPGGISSAFSVEDFNGDGKLDFATSNSPGLQIWHGDSTGNFSIGWTTNASRGGIFEGHLNSDGVIDLAVLNSNFEYVQPFFGNGDGSFTGDERYTVGEVPQDLEIADINGDGINDIVTANFASNEISILIGTGFGSFARAHNQTTSGEANGLVLGDFTNDGILDVVTSGKRNDAIKLTEGYGDGTFRAPTNFDVLFASFPNAAAVDDLDGDGREDIVIARSGWFGISVFLRRGDFRFFPPRKYLRDVYVNFAVIDDFNNDNHLDIFGVGFGVGTMLLGDGNGNFTELPPLQVGQSGGFAVHVGSADFNNDGKTDIVVSDRDHTRIIIWNGNGDGTFSGPPIEYLLGGPPLRIDIGDVNGDGKPDLVIAVNTGIVTFGSVQVRVNAGNGTFPSEVSYNLGTSIHPSSVVTRDFNGDGNLDFAVTTRTDPSLPGQVRVYTGNGTGNFTQIGAHDVPGLNPNDLVAADFNHDGKLDIAAVSNGSEDMTIFAGSGTGSFSLIQTISAGEQPRRIVAGNFNNDTSPDLVATNYNASSFTLVPNECNQGSEVTPTPTRFDFDGDGRADISIFRPGPAEWWYSRSSDGGNNAFQFGQSGDELTPADFTGDGKTDVAFFRPSSGEWFVLRSEDQSFFSFPFGADGDIPAPGEFDGDGIDDAAVFRPSTATWFIRHSSNGLVEVVNFGADGDKPLVGDYDGDQRDDIALYRSSVSEFWILGSGMGVRAYRFGITGDQALAADYTGDGKTDVAFWRPSTGFWYVLRSEDQSFFSFPFGTMGDVPIPGDYDGDGTADPAVFRPSNSTWFLLQSTSGSSAVQFGIANDIPVPSAYLP